MPPVGFEYQNEEIWSPVVQIIKREKKKEEKEKKTFAVFSLTFEVFSDVI